MRTTLHASTPLRKDEQQLVFGWCEVDQPPVARYAMLRAVDRDRAEGENVGGPDTARAEPAENRADAEHELLRTEGLREIIIGAERQAPNAILFFAACGEHEHRDVARGRLGTQLLEDVVARRAGQHQVEDDER